MVLCAAICSAQTPAGTEIRNQAWGSYELKTGDGDTVRSNTTLTVVAPPSGTPRLVLFKQADRPAAAPGSDVAYTIILTNNGSAAATNVIITDTLPAGTSFVAASDGGAISGRVVSWRIASIAIDGHDSVRLVARIDADISAGSILNQAGVACREGRDTSSNTAITDITTFVATSIQLAATPRAIIGDGNDSTVLAATVSDVQGRPAGDGTPVFLTTSHGSFENTRDTITAHTHAGVATAVLHSEAISGNNIVADVYATTMSASGKSLGDTIAVTYYMGAIAGVVRSATNGAPVIGVCLVVYDRRHTEIGRDTTRVGGDYIIPVREPGAHTLEATYVNSFGDRITLMMAVFAEATDAGTAPTKAGNVLAGNLIDATTGTPIRGAGIPVALHAVVIGKPVTAPIADAIVMTTETGLYLFDSLPGGRYELSVKDPRFRGTMVIADTASNSLLIDAQLRVSEIPHLDITISSTKRIVEIGDMARYTIEVTNQSNSTAFPSAWIIDTLPAGFGYAAGSARMNGAAIADPAASHIIVWRLPDSLRSLESATLTYVLIAGAAAIEGDGVNRVQAAAAGLGSDTVWSLPASISITARAGVFTDHGIVLGKVFYDANSNGSQDSDECGVPGVELWMEDGTRIVTGEQGKYSLPDVMPGDRVLRINTATLPTGARLVAAGTAFAGDARSRFVHVVAGGIGRADFYLLAPAQAMLRVTRTDSMIIVPNGSARVSYIIRRQGPAATRSIVLRDTLPQGLYFDLTHITVDDSAVVAGPERSRVLALDLQPYLHGDSSNVSISVVADSTGILKPIDVRPQLILSYPTGVDAVFIPQSISALCPGANKRNTAYGSFDISAPRRERYS